MTGEDQQYSPHNSSAHSDSPEEQALAWFIRLRAEDVTEGERRAFQSWYEADPAHAEAYLRLEAMWASPILDEATRQTAERLEVQGTIRASRSKHWVWRRIAAAVVVLLLIVGAAYCGEPFLRIQADYMTATGEQRRIKLAGGSRVLLDTNSAVASDNDHRTVRLLQGRAYFEVASSKAGEPFQVLAGPAIVQATGTAFAVAHDKAGVTVTLRHGAVKVGHSGHDGERVHITPGKRLRVTDERVGASQYVDLTKAFGWVDGRLVFENRPLEEVVARLRRYHPGAIVIADEELGQARITGNYRLDDPARTVAVLAELASGEVTRLSDYLLILH